MKLIVGLGNIGKKYTSTWHNLGFMALDKLAAKHDFNFKAGKGSYFLASGFICLEKTVLLKPTTYMNNSGLAVAEAMNYFDIDLDDLLIVYDDISLSFGNIRFRTKGSAGGHNGIKSIINHLGTNSFNRLRIGFLSDHYKNVLGKKNGEMPSIVLSSIPASFGEDLDLLLNLTTDAVEYYLENKITKSMNYFNKKEV